MAQSSAKALPFAWGFVLGAALVLGVVACTERPSSFPPCLDPYDNFTNDCPALDAGALDGEASDEDDATSPDGNAGDGGNDVTSSDGDASDGGYDGAQ